ncbi:MAG: glycosyltransferase family 4 protein [Oscillatoria sp. PMC 1051.18]|nr:glycosyltransferase family 4 protein [Oscillatoria sp. PMC 1050.18]MEC5030100.1 glycosyltransferase family 4 protein [Oscillatoria sp. PMC 1051.18]
MKKLNVVMLGPGLEEKGGMGSVETLILNTAPSEVKIEHASTWDGESSTLKLFSQAVTFFLGKLLRGKVDLVHIHVAEGGSTVRKSILALIAFAFRKPVIMHAHGCEFHLFYEKLPKLPKIGLNWVWRRCSYIIVLSESWKKFYSDRCGLKPEQVVVLPNPVAIPESIPDRQNSEQVKFLFLGKINQRKGIFDLLQAFAQLPPPQREKAQLILAGSGEIEQATNLAQSLQIDQQILFPGWITKQQCQELLAQADVFLLPSYNEGLPMALLEGMSWGLPAITTPVGGIPELVTDKQTGLLVNPGDITGLKGAMQSLIEDRSWRLQLGKAARDCVAPLDVKIYSRSLFDIYYSVGARKENQDAKITNLKRVAE